MSSHQINKIIDRLTERQYGPRGNGLQFSARCPAHDDNSPSLSITGTPNGNVLLYCHAGCSTPEIIDKLGLTFNDLFAVDTSRTQPTERDGSQYKGEYRYHDRDGTLLYRVVRYSYTDGRKTFRQHAWRNGTWAPSLQGTETVLYNWPQVDRAIKDGRTIWIVEGEKDVENFMFAGPYIATCNPGGADNGTGRKFTPNMIAALEDATSIAICIDNDQPGEQHARYLYNALNKPGRTVRVFRPTYGKDISDHLKAGHTVNELEPLDSTDDPTGWANETLTPADDPLDPNLNGWDYLDLTTVLTDDYTPPRPEILHRTDGQALLYRGRINSLFGESGSGKSWVALAACAQEINLQHHVVYIDLEDHIAGIVERLEQLGCTRPQLITHFHYLAPFASADDYDLDRLETSITNLNVTLCVFDSVGEAMALGNTNPNADEEVARWYRTLPRRIANAGPAILLNDHQPKNTDTGALFAIGSQRKRAAIDGIAYRVLQKTPFARGESGGRIDLQVAKDRAGTFANKHIAASIHIDSHDDQLTIRITKADEQAAPSDQQRRLETISETMQDLHGEGAEWLTLTDIKNGLKPGAPVRKHTETVRELVTELLEIGCVDQANISKKNIVYRLVNPYDHDMVEWMRDTNPTNEQMDAPAGAHAPDDPRQGPLARSGAARLAPHPLRGGAGATRNPTDTEPIGENVLITNPKRFSG